MRSISAAAAFAATMTAALAASPAAAHADALVYEQGGQGIWMASPDGARKHQVTADVGFTSPSAADDGTLMLVSPFEGMLHRVDRYGRALNAPIPAAPTTAAGNVTFLGTHQAAIAPDGRRQAYGFAFTQASGGGGGEPPTSEGYLSAWFGAADRHDEPALPAGGPLAFSDPSWTGDGELLVVNGLPFRIEPSPQVATIDVDGHAFHPWFSDPQAEFTNASTPWVAKLREGVMNRTHEQVAFVASMYYTGNDGTRNQIRVYRMNGEPPIAPTLQCTLTRPNGEFSRPTWSPDGRRLAWAEADGVHVAEIGDATDCDALPQPLVLPGARAPFWTPADVPPALPRQEQETPRAETPAPPTARPQAPQPAARVTPQAAAGCTVPRVKGKPIRRAKQLLARAGCRVKVSGRKRARRAVVAAQRPRAGTQLPQGGSVAVIVKVRSGRG